MVTGRPLKICHIITGLGSGGAEMTLARLVRHAPRDRFEQSVVTLMGDGLHSGPLREHGVSVTALGMSRRSPSPLPLLRLIGQLRREKPDVVMTWLYHADLMGSLAAWAAGCRSVVWNLRCSDMDLARYSIVTRLVLSILIRLSGCPKLVVANSAAGMRHHQSLGYHPQAWRLIANGLDPQAVYPDQSDRRAVRQELGLADDALAFAMVARFDPMKNQAGFLSALARARQQDKRLHAVLIGRETNALADLAQDLGLGEAVHILGERRDVPRLMRGLDAVVSASLFGEGLSNSVAEAMATALPCIVTDVGDSATLVDKTGYVVRPGDEDSLAQAILALASLSTEERLAKGKAARQRIEEQYSLSAMLEAYGRLFSDLT